MTPMVQKWGKKTGRLSFGIDFGDERRLDRQDWKISPADIASGNYVDAHMPRPYKDHKDSIDKLLKGLEKNP